MNAIKRRLDVLPLILAAMCVPACTFALADRLGPWGTLGCYAALCVFYRVCGG